MTDSYLSPLPRVENVQEGDILELDGDLFVAIEDGKSVENSRPYSDEGDEYAVELRGAPSGHTKCVLSEQSSKRTDEDRDLFLWSHWDMGYKKRGPVNEFNRCYRSQLKISIED